MTTSAPNAATPASARDEVIIRRARVGDAAGIHALLKTYSEQERLLARPISEIYALIPQFFVAELAPETPASADNTDTHKLAGCAALEVFTDSLGEVRSLAVHSDYGRRGIGRKLVDAVEQYAASLGLEKIMALTYEEPFFHKLGYQTVLMQELPEKVWRVCVKCPKFHQCDEIPMLKILSNPV